MKIRHTAASSPFPSTILELSLQDVFQHPTLHDPRNPVVTITVTPPGELFLTTATGRTTGHLTPTQISDALASAPAPVRAQALDAVRAHTPSPPPQPSIQQGQGQVLQFRSTSSRSPGRRLGKGHWSR